MNEPESLIRNISDTARWVAIYRARETERTDAVFRDQLARRLAGERGEQIAASMSFAEKNSWPFVARTWLIDQVISSQVKLGTDMVVNLAAGLDARPYRMNLPGSLRWIEVDLPEILAYKEDVLRDEMSGCQLERVRLDLSDVRGRRELFSRVKKVVAAAPPAQSVTPRPAVPPGKSEGARARDRRDTEEENKGKKAPGERGSSTDLTV